ncbi:MAG: hypothetical protein K2Y18_10070 [Alphaproteobacteria bacterium]|jgi:hypothetical protein|nr:hypothetical protein [Alphaproteobacteria bacterium]
MNIKILSLAFVSFIAFQNGTQCIDLNNLNGTPPSTTNMVPSRAKAPLSVQKESPKQIPEIGERKGQPAAVQAAAVQAAAFQPAAVRHGPKLHPRAPQQLARKAPPSEQERLALLLEQISNVAGDDLDQEVLAQIAALEESISLNEKLEFQRVLEASAGAKPPVDYKVNNSPVVDMVPLEVHQEQSLEAITFAVRRAQAELREVHIFLGAGPYEDHVAAMLVEEGKREQTDPRKKVAIPFKCPVRIYVAEHTTIPKGQVCNMDSLIETPVLIGNFNDVSHWDLILKAMFPKEIIPQENYDGVYLQNIRMFAGCVDKIYFDTCASNCADWKTDIMSRISRLLKPTGAIYLQDKPLASQSKHPNFKKVDGNEFCDGWQVFDKHFDGSNTTHFSEANREMAGNYQFEACNNGGMHPDIGLQHRGWGERNIEFIKASPVLK